MPIKSLIDTMQWDPDRKLNAKLSVGDDIVACGEACIKIEGSSCFFTNQNGLKNEYQSAKLIIDDGRSAPEIKETLNVIEAKLCIDQFTKHWHFTVDWTQ